MATINDKFFADLAKGASWAAGVSFQRSNPLPLDKYSVFNSLEAAETYATTNAVAYPGQVIAVINEGVMEVYVLAETANEVGEGEEQTYSLGLQQLGGKLEINEDCLQYNEETGELELFGFDGAATATLPQKKIDENGNESIEWVTIDSIVEGDGNTTYTVTPLKKNVGTEEEPVEEIYGFKLTPSEGAATEIALDVYTKTEVDEAIAAVSAEVAEEAERAADAEEALDGKITELATTVANNKTAADDALALKANAADVYTKEETDEKIGDAVKGILGEDVSDAYDTLVEIQKLMEADDTASAELVAKVNANEAAIEKLNGDAETEGSVAKSIADAIAGENLAQYAKAADVESTYAKAVDVESTYAKAADVESTYAKAADVESTYAKAADVESTYVTKATATAENGVRFINQDEIDILGNLNLSGDGKVEISGQVNSNNVLGLYDKVTAIITGTNSELDLDPNADGVQAGLGIESGAQVNKIEKVVFNGVEASIDNKIATITGEYYTKTETDAAVKVASDAASAAQTTANAAKTAAEANATEISTTNATVAGHTTKIGALEQSSTQHGSDIEALQTASGTHGSDIAQLKTDVQGATATANANNTKIAELIAADVTINNELARLESAKANAADVYAKADVYTKAEVNGIVGDLGENATIVAAIAAAKAEATYDDTQVKSDIAANAAAIEKLNGDDTVVGSVDYKVAQEVAKILNDNDPSDIDTLNEIAAWIISDTTGAAKMNADIAANKAAIDKLNGSATTEGSVLKMIADAAPGIATASTAGLVKSNAVDDDNNPVENSVAVATDGTMSVNSLNVNRLVQTAGETLILNGGSAAIA